MCLLLFILWWFHLDFFIHINFKKFFTTIDLHVVFQMPFSLTCPFPYSLLNHFLLYSPLCNLSILSALSLHHTKFYFLFLSILSPPWSLTMIINTCGDLECVTYIESLKANIHIQEKTQYLSFGIWITISTMILFLAPFIYHQIE